MEPYDSVDLKTLSDEQAAALCETLRGTILRTVSQTGGHLASSLGTVELTVAIHRVFDLSRDRLVFDVGHQCYSHKLLTGRADRFDTLRTLGGLAGFPKPKESYTDAFIAGHASNSVSVALGMARARTLQGKSYHVLALLGDGALTGGLAYEGLSNAGQSGEKLLVILNDNGMSITQNVGGMSRYLARQRLKPQYLNFKKGYRKVMGATALGRKVYQFNHKVKTAVKDALLPCSMFENMGFTYMGPVDGHNVKLLTRLLRHAKDAVPGPVLLHVKTVKGKGYPPAEAAPEKFHGVGPFDLATGAPLSPGEESFSHVFGETLCALAEKDPKLCAVTAAMCPGTGLSQFAQRYPDRFFDVGIAEGHAAAMCAGMAKQGMTPVFAVYSTFLQRSYDMLLHDVSLLDLHVVFCVDRAGLVGEDGETHHGVFDVGFLSSVPGMTILAPSSYAELRTMLDYAVHKVKGPVAVRYPRGGEGAYTADSAPAELAVIRLGTDVTLAGYGTQVGALLDAADLLERDGVSAEVVKLNNLTPKNWGPLMESIEKTGALWFYEEVMDMGCVGRRVAADLALSHVPTRYLALRNLGDKVPPHGTVEQLRRACGLDASSIARQVKEVTALEKAAGRSAI